MPRKTEPARVKVSLDHVTEEMWDRVWDLLDRHEETKEKDDTEGEEPDGDDREP